MKTLWIFLFMLPQLAAAQENSPAGTRNGAPNAPAFGLRAGYVSGRLRPTEELDRYRAQAGWEVGGVMSSNRARVVGVELDATINCLRFTDRPDAAGGASYRWITAQPMLIGFVRPNRYFQLLAGGGLNLCLSCWRWPFQEQLGGYGNGGGDQASNKTSEPSAVLLLVGARGNITPRWFVEGRYVKAIGEGGYRFYKTDIVGKSAWGTFSIGYWLSPQSAGTAQAATH